MFGAEVTSRNFIRKALAVTLAWYGIAVTSAPDGWCISLTFGGIGGAVPRGKTKFDRCVKAVTKRGAAYDPRAVCGAMRARGELNPATVIRYAVRPARTINNWEIWEVVRDEHGKESWSRKVETVRNKREARARVAELNSRIRRNPADTSAEAYERFHGRKPTEYVKVTKRIHHHANLWSIGDLKKLKIKAIDGRSIVSLSSFKGTVLAANEQAFSDLAREGHARLTQLFIEGGDQSVDLRSFGIDPDDAHELETLGKATLIDYRTVKVHLGDEGGDAVYRHKFRSTRAGDKHVTLRVARYPDVIYRVLDKQLEFSGGSYEIRAEGIDK